jgi:SAM-dependent methyltransferase
VAGWDELTDWWLDEIAADPAYDSDVLPLVLDVFTAPGGPVLDLGCGNGRIMDALEIPDVVGCDLNAELLERARGRGPVVRARLPGLEWMRDGSVGAVVVVMVIEHVDEVERLYRETFRVTRVGGTLTVVMNHPAYTARGAGPVVDQTDGEVMWRWGPYFERGSSDEPAGHTTVTFHHRSLGSLVTTAARAGWLLELLEERPLGPEAVARHPGLVGQEHIPRLLGVRWRKPGRAARAPDHAP